VPEEKYMRKKIRIPNSLKFWVGSGDLTFLYEMLMTHWCRITLTFSHKKKHNKKKKIENKNELFQKIKLTYIDQ